MFPSDIIVNISHYLPYSDFISLISTCSEYYNNEYIRTKRRSNSVSSNNLLFLAISLNDIEMIKLIAKSLHNIRICSPESNDLFLELLADNSNFEMFKFITGKWEITFHFPPGLKEYSIYHDYISDYHGKAWSYMLKVIEKDRDDMMDYFIKTNLGLCAEIIFVILRKSINYNSSKIISLLLTNEAITKYNNLINQLIINELRKNNICILKDFIKHFKYIEEVTFLKLLSSKNLKIKKYLLDTSEY